MPHDFACSQVDKIKEIVFLFFTLYFSQKFCVFFDSTSIRMDPKRMLGITPGPDRVPSRLVYFPRKSKGAKSVQGLKVCFFVDDCFKLYP